MFSYKLLCINSPTFWLTSKSLYQPDLCEHWLPSRRTTKSNSQQKQIVRESQRNPCSRHVLMMIIMIYGHIYYMLLLYALFVTIYDYIHHKSVYMVVHNICNYIWICVLYVIIHDYMYSWEYSSQLKLLYFCFFYHLYVCLALVMTVYNISIIRQTDLSTH